MKPFNLLFFALYCFVLFPAFSTDVRADENQIVVGASGKVSVKPDMAEFGALVKSVAKNADQAAARTAEKYRAVQQALRQAGIPAEDAPTASFTVSPQWEWNQSQGKNVLNGYSARHLIMVKVRNLSLAGKAVDAAVQAGADEVQQITFRSSRYDALRRQALSVAVANARGDAEIMAKAAGGRLGGLIELSVGQPIYRPSPAMDMMAMKAAAPEAAPTEIAPSEEDIVVNVSSRWRFLGASAR
ncbi:MAG: SIMPL domain-containing protein [Chlorobium sp.]|uniref:SIMPL domain-containing protein n=1 Tax=Chlorobium sp. TaxID=1095 RepID=UPI0025C46CB4|nr:SIMPL domain-containing protein [Chlorobium sp.]MCF8382970.1 SIMPL domain-containing protein [Chlorobium sp.]